MCGTVPCMVGHGGCELQEGKSWGQVIERSFDHKLERARGQSMPSGAREVAGLGRYSPPLAAVRESLRGFLVAGRRVRVHLRTRKRSTG